MGITYLKGDATDPQAKGQKIIAHVVNSAGKWGKGFVLAVSRKWPEVRRTYLDWYNRGEGFELGSVLYVRVTPYITVANMLAQEGIKTGSKGPPIRYEALRKCLVDVGEMAKNNGASVHAPKIGSGLAGGRWELIEPIIEQAIQGPAVYVYDYTP